VVARDHPAAAASEVAKFERRTLGRIIHLLAKSSVINLGGLQLALSECFLLNYVVPVVRGYRESIQLSGVCATRQTNWRRGGKEGNRPSQIGRVKGYAEYLE
jgi:hypothetical protein